MIIPNKDSEWLEWFEYYTKLEYLPSYYFMLWNNWEVNNGELEVEEGWKTHIVIETQDEYMFAMHNILPHLRKEKISHKITHFTRFEELNLHDIQKGKIITIYEPNLSFISQFPSDVMEFLLTKSNINIITDKHIGGRIFVRYSNYKKDTVFNPITQQDEYMPREEGIYKPLWIDEPPTLNELLSLTMSY